MAAISVLIIGATRPMPFRNGSFESATDGWTLRGNVELERGRGDVTDGVVAAVFNAHDRTGIGSALSQRFRTTRGVRYELAFDLGATGAVADQIMHVTVQGHSTLLDQRLVVAGLSAAPYYVPQRLSFVADGSSATVTFADRSATYVGIDTLLDNVRLTPTKPGSPVITAPPSRLAVAEGTDAWFRVEASGSAPLSYRWQHDGHDIANATDRELCVRSVTAADAGNYAVVVEGAAGTAWSSAATLTVLPPAVILNGSFEYGSAAWSFEGRAVSTSTNTGYGVTDGRELVHFNWGQAPPGGSVSQRFSTTPGQGYVLDFDVGAFSLVNRDEQRMKVSVTGGRVLLDETVSVHAPGNGGGYEHRQYRFVADNDAATVRFEDVSTRTENVDLLLDHVQISTTRPDLDSR